MTVRLSLLLMLYCLASGASALCAAPGRDGQTEMEGVVNLYLAGPEGEDLAAGTRELPFAASRGEGVLREGDLLLVVQMQGADIESSNDADYGAGRGDGRGWRQLQAGDHERVRVEEVADERVRIRGAGRDGGLVHDYRSATPERAGDTGARRWQLVRIPQYERLALSGDLQALPWDGTTGGILAVDVRRSLSLEGSALDASGMGFRGGAPLDLAGALGRAGDYRYPAPDARERAAGYGQHALKGEGLAGTPRWVIHEGEVVEPPEQERGGSDGYPDGAMARGAPGNAGGGGNSLSLDNREVSGGGGGGGGRSGATGRDQEGDTSGGIGGDAAGAMPPRLIAGGGGGAGSRRSGEDLASGGGAGGGILMVQAGRLEGPGALRAAGLSGQDGEVSGGGGGGGGTLLLLSAFGSLEDVEIGLDGGAGGQAPASGGAGGAGRLLLGGGLERGTLPQGPSTVDDLRAARLSGVAPGFHCSPSGTLISGRIMATTRPAAPEEAAEGMEGRRIRVLDSEGTQLAKTRTGGAGQYSLELSETLADEELLLEMDLPEGWYPVQASGEGESVVYQGEGRWRVQARQEIHHEGLSLALMPEPALEGPEPREVKPGNTEIFLFRYLPGAEGRVRFSWRAEEDDDWEHRFFLDPECDGASQYFERDRTRWLRIRPGDPVCVRVRVRVPETVPGEVLTLHLFAETDPGDTALEPGLPELRAPLRARIQP